MKSFAALAFLIGWLALAGPARAGLSFYQDLRLAVDLDGDGRTELVTLLWDTAPDRPARYYLAWMGLDDGRRPHAGFFDLGEAVRVLDARTEAGRVALEVIQAAAQSGRLEKRVRRWALQNGRLVELESEPLGAASIEDLAGSQWRLVAMDDQPVKEGPTLVVEKERLHGRSGCNDYFAQVKDAEGEGGALQMGPVGSSRKACKGPAKALEERYLDRLRHVQGFLVQGDRLRLLWRRDGRQGTLEFREVPRSGEKSG